ncbi:hypothetical protein [Lactobacillus paragasseri]|uniref:Replication initiation protein n=1 Tax=Lactobacillus paragasseri TaxID=2107999 RepID=A0ABD5A2W7_9LACO|nr:hypothetical protein [Lactobacillus paragasseri]MDK7953362.1 hypothetical protein [Lactobacillus paragasseri]MDO6362205.1 hypothetical protein [Lactobacillus paragasseri]MDX5060540.1 hypothetical protein [Lactobacillus paragasseri]
MAKIKKKKSVKNIHRKNKSKPLYLTSRLRVQILDPMNEPKENLCVISWDWITLTGTLFADLNRSTLLELGWHEKKPIDGYVQQFEMMKGKQQIARLVRNEYHGRNSWRLETSNHLTDAEKEKLTKTAQLMRDDVHITRLDLAFDFINCKNSGMTHRIYKPNTTTDERKAQNGLTQTLQVGKRDSDIQYIYYNKFAKLKEDHFNVPKGIKTWERLELKLRHRKVNEWITQATKMLKYYKLPSIKDLSKLSSHDSIMLTAFVYEPALLATVSKGTRAKYRRLMRENEKNCFNTDRQEMALAELSGYIPELNKELLEFDGRLAIPLLSMTLNDK